MIRYLDDNPFATDDELCRHFQVSIQTIRLDRLELGIPELRERLKAMAEQSYDQVRSLPLHEVIGEIIDLQLDRSGISLFEIREEHVFSRNGIARGHPIFAQANSLAIALINEEMALTASAEIRYLRPVRLGEKCVAKGLVTQGGTGIKGMVKVQVNSYVGDELVFEGKFMIYRQGGKDA